MNNKYYSLQILRAIAAWMVVFHHYMQLFYDFESSSLIGHFFSQYGAFGVDIFFALSGFVMYMSTASKSVTSGEFFVNRVFRIIPAYWFYTLSLIAFLFLFPKEFSFTSYNTSSLLASFLFYPSENPSGIGVFPLLTVGWSLNFEMMFYLILSISIFLSRNKALVICFITILILPPIFPKVAPYSEILGSKYMHEFLIGFIVAYIVSRGYLDKLSNRTEILTLLFLVVGILIQVQSKKMACFFILLSFISLESFINKENSIVKFMIKLGDYSYSTYLLHIFVLGVFLHFVGVNENFIIAAITLVCISISILLLSKYSYLLIERNKYLASMKKNILRNRLT